MKAGSPQAHRSLTPEQIRFEIDMCVGCDRCMRACPVPLSAKVSIAELNKATIEDTISPLIERFTDECVLCGSCVPVCPVDNHRDLLMLSLKERLGSSWEVQANVEHVREVLPDGWNIEQLLNRLREQPMLCEESLIPDNYLLHLVNSSQLLITRAGEWLMYEGEFGRDLILILSGRVELSSTGPGETGLPIAVLRRGEYLGEHEMLNGQPRQFSARTVSKCALLVVPEQVAQRLMELVPEVRVFFESLDMGRSIETALARLPLLEGIAAIDLRHLAEQAITRRYERGELLFSEENQDQPERETLHLLLDGFVKVVRQLPARRGRGERIIAYRQSGDYFAGGLDMLGDQRAVSVSAITRITVAEIPRGDLLHLFRRYPQVKARFQEQLQLYHDSRLAAQSAIFEPFQFEEEEPAHPNTLSDAATRAGLHAIVDDGVVEGTEVLIIDLAKCIQCNECEEACKRRHGYSRMNRKGLVVGNISIATACRQCQDPVCLLCSRAGIARLPSGEVYITESCIGCGICAERCPYDNISIVDLEEQEQTQGKLWKSFNSLFGGKKRKTLPVLAAPGPLDAAPTLDPIEEMRKKIAIKCDLCAGYNDQACVQSCPTGAAIRVNPRTFFGSTEDILLK